MEKPSLPYCMNCGKEISDQAAFCTFCGKATNFSPETATSNVPMDAVAVPRPSSGHSLLEAREVVMKKKIFSLREHYDFEDPSGRKLGEGDGNFFQVPAKFTVLSVTEGFGNSHLEQVMHVDGKLISLRHEFRLYDSSGNLLGVMKKKIVKLIGQEYWLEQNGVELMRVYGNFTAHEYQLSVNGQIVSQVHKKWIAIRDQFEVSIVGNIDPRLVIGSIIVVEHVEVTSRDHNNSSGFGF